MKKDKRIAPTNWRRRLHLPWYGLIPILGDGRLGPPDKRRVILGPRLLDSLIDHLKADAVLPGDYAVVVWVPITSESRPDWGSFRFVAKDRWLLRSTDCAITYAPAGDGSVIQLHTAPPACVFKPIGGFNREN